MAFNTGQILRKIYFRQVVIKDMSGDAAEQHGIPSLNQASVASRFVSQKDIERARTLKEEQWKAAYERIGQEPPKLQEDPNYDGRSLHEILAANKAAKQEEWENRSKLSAQFRPLDADEIKFLDTVLDARTEAERKRKAEDDEEVKSFREAAAKARHIEAPPILEGSSSSKPTTTASKPSGFVTKSSVKKDQKTLLKGVVVAKKKRKEPEPAPDTGPQEKKQKLD